MRPNGYKNKHHTRKKAAKKKYNLGAMKTLRENVKRGDATAKKIYDTCHRKTDEYSFSYPINNKKDD